MPAAMIALSPDLERLIDERLDAVDRILSLSRTARSERMQILSDLESQIRDRLVSRTSEEPTRADLLAVLAELDPPEAYLDESVSISPAFRASGFANEGSQRVAGDTLAASIPASQNKKGQLALWAGFLVSTGCILTSLSVLMAFMEGPTLPALLVQLIVFSGSILAIASLGQMEHRSILNRLITWACIGTIPWTVLFVIGWLNFMNISNRDNGLITALGASFIPLGAVVHGAWLGLITVLFLLERKTAEG